VTADALVTSPWTALRSRPDRFLSSSWPWRSFSYLLATAVTGLVTLTAAMTVVVVGVLTLPLVAGFFVLRRLPTIVSIARTSERSRLPAMLTGTADVPSHHPGTALAGAAREPVTPGEVSYVVLLSGAIWVVDFVVTAAAIVITGSLAIAPLLAWIDTFDLLWWEFVDPLETLAVTVIAVPIALVADAYLVTAIAAGQAVIAAHLLGLSDERLQAEIVDLRRSRLTLVDAFEAERSRIERDIHDGIQQRLIGLTMLLGRAELDLPAGPGLDLVTRAHHEADTALSELRETVRGIHPRVLTDHGLEAAIREIADRMPVTVTIDISLRDRLDAAVETTAYFVTSEALSNVAKHARASAARVQARAHGHTLVVTITDDGVGGATISPGSGLSGLVTRLDALGGALTLTSPPGGPTTVRMECPCAPAP
jgi:signal transduction histidine kinase